jgi:RNA polymerase sigma-70 factor (ECF subfamily)
MSDTTRPLPLRVATATDDADRAVLVRIANGELQALDELYERYKTMAYSIAYRITNDAALAEDVVQEAFLGAWRNAGRYIQGRGSVKTWLLSIVHHRAIDAVRRRRPTTPLPEREDVPPAALTLPDVWSEVIATRTNTPLGTVKSRMRLGLLAMRRALLERGAAGSMDVQEVQAP